MQIRLSAQLALAAAAAVAFAAVLAPLPSPAAPNDACNQALAYEKTAANDSVTRQAAYDSAVAGLSANQRCNDPAMKLVNEAYLLSMRAPAEHDLHLGDWKRDLTRANMLLLQCTNWPDLRNKKAAIDCATQRRYNDIVAKTLSTQPTPLPAPSAAATAGPGASAVPRAMPLPNPPGPSRPPR